MEVYAQEAPRERVGSDAVTHEIVCDEMHAPGDGGKAAAPAKAAALRVRMRARERVRAIGIAIALAVADGVAVSRRIPL